MANQNLRRTFDVTYRKRNTIKELQDSIRNVGIVKTNQFVVRLNFPQGPANRPFRPFSGVMNQQDLLVRAQNVFMPGTNFSTVEDNNIYGPNRNIVSGITFANTVGITFLLDEKFELKQTFDAWQRTAYDENTWNLNYYDEYKGAIEIYSMTNSSDNTGTDVPGYGLKCWEAYPVTIGQVDFDATATTSFATINIEFGFRYTTDISRYGSASPFDDLQPEPNISQSPRDAADVSPDTSPSPRNVRNLSDALDRFRITTINPADATEI